MAEGTKQQGSSGAEEQSEPRLERADLIASWVTLGASSPTVVEGALATHERKTHTLDEAKKLVDAHVKRKVGAEIEHYGSQDDSQEG